MNAQLLDLESYLTRGSVAASKVLGMSYSNYAALKCGSRELPPYIATHIDTLKRLDAEALNDIVRQRLLNGRGHS